MDRHDLPEPRTVSLPDQGVPTIEVQIEDRDFRAPEVTEPELAAEATMDREALHQAMWRLPEEQRVAITLVDLAGLSTAEAARAMGTPRGTVLSRLHRGRRGLAALLWVEVGR